jgi:aminoglycoside 6-adenylyltransferase
MTNPLPDIDVIHSLSQSASALEAIRAVLLTSTRAIPEAKVDALSDFDVILVMDDHTWLDEFGEVLVAYWDPIHPDPLFGIDRCANVIQYRHGLKIDFTLWPVTLLQQITAAPSLTFHRT